MTHSAKTIQPVRVKFHAQCDMEESALKSRFRPPVTHCRGKKIIGRNVDAT